MPFDPAQRSLGQRLIAQYQSIANNPISSVKKTVAVLTLIVFSCGINLAQATPSYKTLYKSTGKFGEIKYSQFEPKAGSKFEVILMRSDGIQSQPGLLAAESADEGNQSTGYGSSQDQNPTFNPSTASASSQPVSQPVAHSQCQKLRNNLTSLKAEGEIYESQANGERRFLNPIEVALKLEDTQKLLAQYCKTY